MIFHKLVVTEQHPVFAVNRHHKLWPHRFGHYANVFLRSMAADVNEPPLFFDDVRAAFVDETDKSRNRPFVAGNDARRKDNRVALFDR